MVGARVFKLFPPSYVKCFRKTHKTLSEGERERVGDFPSILLSPPCSLCYSGGGSDFQFPGNQPKRQSSAKRQPEQAAGNLETSTRTCGTHTHIRTLTCKHKLKFPPYSARSCRSFLRFQSKNLNAYVICAG